MSIKNIYKNRLGNAVFLTRVGKPLHFVDGKHITDVQADIAELEAELKSNNPHIYVDPAESQVDTTLQDRIAEAQRKATLEVLNEYAPKTTDPSTVSDQKSMVPAQQAALTPAALLNVTTSANLAGLAAPSGT